MPLKYITLKGELITLTYVVIILLFILLILIILIDILMTLVEYVYQTSKKMSIPSVFLGQKKTTGNMSKANQPTFMSVRF